jgi:two-component system chemotaxis response regulator CheY
MSFRILIVDDSKSMRKVLIKTVKMSQVGEVDFLEAENGKEALSILSNEWVDIVFTDLNMPIMSGYDFIEKLRLNPMFSETPVFVITSDTRIDEIKTRIKADINGIILKPFRPETIREYISEALNLTEYDDEDDNFEGVDF